jgi:hypothetical protein
MSVESTNALRTHLPTLPDQPLAVTFRFPGALRHTLRDSHTRAQSAHRVDLQRPAMTQTRTGVSQIMLLTDAASPSDTLGRMTVQAERVS